MSLKKFFSVPVLPVNNYLWDTMKRIEPGLADDYDGIIPFIPLADARGGDSVWKEKPYVIYDYSIRPREWSFYPIHHTHFYYMVRGRTEDALVWTNAIGHILDRQDDAAKDINSFMVDQYDETPVFFHSFKVMSQERVEDRTRLDSAVDQFYQMSLTVDAKYHLNNANANFEYEYGKGPLYDTREVIKNAETVAKINAVSPDIETETTQAEPKPGEAWKKKSKPKKKLEW